MSAGISRQFAGISAGTGRRLTLGDHGCHMPTMSQIRKVCVYCGSSAGTDPAFVAAATRLGEVLAEAGIGLVYGGGSAGLMGALAKSMHARGGEIVGIIPEFLKAKENMFRGASEIVVTRGMHDRKQLMFERSDAFVALPGGIGTLEELVEQLTWAQLGRHKKPILIANLKGFWDGLLAVFEHMSRAGYIHSGPRLSYVVVDNVEDIVPALKAAAAAVSEDEKAGEKATVERL
jgi:uncharacterized protein (TIGR00730 family)